MEFSKEKLKAVEQNERRSMIAALKSGSSNAKQLQRQLSGQNGSSPRGGRNGSSPRGRNGSRQHSGSREHSRSHSPIAKLHTESRELEYEEMGRLRTDAAEDMVDEIRSFLKKGGEDSKAEEETRPSLVPAAGGVGVRAHGTGETGKTADEYSAVWVQGQGLVRVKRDLVHAWSGSRNFDTAKFSDANLHSEQFVRGREALDMLSSRRLAGSKRGGAASSKTSPPVGLKTRPATAGAAQLRGPVAHQAKPASMMSDNWADLDVVYVVRINIAYIYSVGMRNSFGRVVY